MINTMKKLFITLAILLFAWPCWGATYYVRADGSAANKAAATGPATDSTLCMSMATANGETYASGDIVIYAEHGGNFTSTLVPPTAGVTYEGTSGLPYIDVRTEAADSCIAWDGVANVTIKNFRLMGCGGAAAVRIQGASTGTVLDNIRVMRNYGAGAGNNDGFSFAGTSVTTATNLYAEKCRPEAGLGTGSHQGITTHNTAVVTVDTMSIIDSTYWAVVTDSSQLTISRLTTSSSVFRGLSMPAEALAAARLTITDSALAINYAAGKILEVLSGVAATSQILISNSIIDIQNCTQGYFYNTVNIDNCVITLNDDGFNMVAKTGSILNFTDNTVTVTDVGVYAFRNDTTGGTMNFQRNHFTGLAAGDYILRWYNTSGTGGGVVCSNIFKEFGGGAQAILIGANCNDTPLIANNVFFNSSASGEGIDNDGASGDILNVTNNICYNVTDSIAGAASLSATYNDYFQSSDEGGVGSITTDPKFVSATDLHLLVSSPCIDAGVDLTATVTTDIDNQSTTHANMDGDADGSVTDMDIGADQVLFLMVIVGE